MDLFRKAEKKRGPIKLLVSEYCRLNNDSDIRPQETGPSIYRWTVFSAHHLRTQHHASQTDLNIQNGSGPLRLFNSFNIRIKK